MPLDKYHHYKSVRYLIHRNEETLKDVEERRKKAIALINKDYDAIRQRLIAQAYRWVWDTAFPRKDD